ncbi:GIY-YIG nuclease family protein [Alkaliphilus peptidifermentans]|uniref:Excinuclease ABC subunit C n=1 Tax=Alkaliphilus peptidifermentans DSM 18978 TaxID=1120976 RepID=A0A1G5EXW0_9FIRM|nr:GIY-YIG nuclease family protein [Alkaliphilus peptidifermentans]SCY31826.1 excinuclease ABC subunit C [Alkaliphilus peptidifermentans DSM 18978]
MTKESDKLLEKIKLIPDKPGIYQMKDINGNIIYIGKSKTLRSRAKSYFNTQHEWNKIKRMVFSIHDISYITTDTHLEAQILECALIKKIKPIYNSQYRNDEKYVYLRISNQSQEKPIYLAYIKEKDPEICFGPFRSKGIVTDIIKRLENIYPIVKQNGSYEFSYKAMTESMNSIMFEENYKSLIEIFTDGNSMKKFKYNVEEKMKKEAINLRFETAAMYKDILNYLDYLYNYLFKTNETTLNKVLMGERLQDGYKIFYISNERIILKRKYKDIKREAIEAFLAEAMALAAISIKINEKRLLDFKNILRSEIEDYKPSKVLLIIDEGNHYDIDEFVEKLLSINPI